MVGARHFLNEYVKRWVKQQGGDHIKNLDYDHKSNETVGRCAQTLLQLLRRKQFAHLNLQQWELIPEVEKQVIFSYNSDIYMMPL